MAATNMRRIPYRIGWPLALLTGLILAMVTLGGTPALAACTAEITISATGGREVADSGSPTGRYRELNEGSSLTVRARGFSCHTSRFDYMLVQGGGLRFSDTSALSYSITHIEPLVYASGKATYDYTFSVTASQDSDEDNEIVTVTIVVDGYSSNLHNQVGIKDDDPCTTSLSASSLTIDEGSSTR